MPPSGIFAPDYRPNEIRPKRAKRQKGKWFAQGELMRLCQTVRKASDPITAKEVALAIMQQKDFDANDEAGYTPGEWTFSLGAGAGFAPDYEGSEDYTVPLLLARAQRNENFVTLEANTLGANLLHDLEDSTPPLSSAASLASRPRAGAGASRSPRTSPMPTIDCWSG